MDANERLSEKQEYVTPGLRVIELVPQEVVLGSCKVSGSSGPDGVDCGGFTPCSDP